MHRRLRVVLAGVVAAFVVASGTLAQGTTSASAETAPIWPAGGALFGAYVSIDAHTGATREAAWSKFETQAGRRMDVDRQFKRWNEPCVNSSDAASVAAGRRLLISWDAKRT